MSNNDRTLLQDVIKQRLADTSPGMKEDRFFELFSSEQILKSRGFDLDVDEIESGNMGGGLDGGVDSFYFFLNRKLVREDTDLSQVASPQANLEVFIIQSKSSSGYEEAAIDKIANFCKDCLSLTDVPPGHVKKLYSERLLESVARFHKVYRSLASHRPTVNIDFIYNSTGDQIADNIKIKSDLLKEQVQGLYSSASISFEFAGAKELFKWYQIGPTKTLNLRVLRDVRWPQSGNSYLCFVALKDFDEFISEDGELRGYLFESNVRDYQGDVEVNKNIALTLDNPEEDEFWWLNNGVTLLASKVAFAGGLYSITDPLIVNGLQTSYEIHRYFKRSTAPVDARDVLVRIIQTTDGGSMDRIIKATNSQTKIPSVWLHATEEIHRKIETSLKLSGLHYDRRKNLAKNQGVAPRKIITIPYLAQAVAAILLQKPNDARARPTTVAEKNYAQMFSTQYPIEIYNKCASIQRRVDEFLESTSPGRAERLNLSFYLSMVTTAHVLKTSKVNLAALAQVDLNLFTDDVLTECLSLVRTYYEKAGGNDKAAKGPNITIRLKKYLNSKFPLIREKAQKPLLAKKE